MEFIFTAEGEMVKTKERRQAREESLGCTARSVHTHRHIVSCCATLLDPMPRSIYRHCQCAALFILMCLFFCLRSDKDGCCGWQRARQSAADPLKSIRFPIRRQLFLGEMEACFELPSRRKAVLTVSGSTRTGMLKADYHTGLVRVPQGTQIQLVEFRSRLHLLIYNTMNWFYLSLMYFTGIHAVNCNYLFYKSLVKRNWFLIAIE